MGHKYHIDTEQYSLARFQHNIASREMIPSRRCLKDELDARFKLLEDAGISNLKDVIDALKSKSKVERFSQDTGLPVDYLTILKREANSYLPNPIRLDRFPGIPAEYVARLGADGIKNSRQIFDQLSDREQRERIAQRTGIPIDILDEFVSLSDLARAYGVGPSFARMIYDVGIRSIRIFVEHSAEEFIRIYEEQQGKRADFSAGEIQFSIDLARELDIAVDL